MKLFITSIILLFVGFSIPKNLEKKVNKQIRQTFNIEEFQLHTIDFPSNKLTKVINSTNFNSISANKKSIGYVLVDKAKSKAYEFDYLVLLNLKLEIINIKILIYREEHGNEISSKRWLKQFFGLTGNDRAILQKNIDGISGATISVRSMTNEIDLLLQDLNVLIKYKHC